MHIETRYEVEHGSTRIAIGNGSRLAADQPHTEVLFAWYPGAWRAVPFYMEKARKRRKN
jgi:hypothetical protein